MIFLLPGCWVILILFARVVKKNNEQLARDSLTNMPIRFIAIENKEKEKAEVQRNIDRIAIIDKLSKKLLNSIICIGLFCIASSFVLQLKNLDFETPHSMTKCKKGGA